MKRKPKVYAVVDVDGSFLEGPSNNKSEVLRGARIRWGDHAFKATTFVPADPRRDAVVRAAVKWATLNPEGFKYNATIELVAAVEKLRKGK